MAAGMLAIITSNGLRLLSEGLYHRLHGICGEAAPMPRQVIPPYFAEFIF